jgi:hypothetical protein
MHPLLGAHVVNGEELQLVVAICDEGSGLILVNDTHKVMTTCLLCLFCFCWRRQQLPSKCSYGGFLSILYGSAP